MTMVEKYDRPIQVADNIFWVGFRDEQSKMTCNPYLVVEGNQALLIDSGSRTDFAVVMMKILQTGIDPKNVVGLIYQHYDPDLCGSMPNFIDMFDNPDLKIISHRANNSFISFYISREKYHLLDSIDNYDYCFDLGGRKLEFIPTPYAHSPGSFVTYDNRTRTVFSSDLFGSSATHWDLFVVLNDECFTCDDFDNCPNRMASCHLKEMIAFHRKILPCRKALRYAMGKIKNIDIDRIAPQHGSILSRRKDINYIIETLEGLEKVGIDAII